jgi:hypothetical protein
MLDITGTLTGQETQVPCEVVGGFLGRPPREAP